MSSVLPLISTQTRMRCESEVEENNLLWDVRGEHGGRVGKGRKVWAERRYGNEGLLGWGEKR